MSDTPPDWAAIRREYEAGIYPSIRALATAHGVSHTAIGKRSRAEGWSATLAEASRQARQAVQAAENGAQAPLPAVLAITTAPAAEAAQAVQTAAAVVIEVVRQHRRAIARDMERLDGFLGFLDLAVQMSPPDTALQVDGLAETFEKLVRCRERLVRLERTAFGLGDKDRPGDDSEGGALNAEQKEALRAAIAARFVRPVVDVTLEPTD